MVHTDFELEVDLKYVNLDLESHWVDWMDWTLSLLYTHTHTVTHWAYSAYAVYNNYGRRMGRPLYFCPVISSFYLLFFLA